MKRRSFMTASAMATTLIPKLVYSQEFDSAAPRDWSGNTPLRYPDPDLVPLDNRFRRYILFNTPIQRHHVGTMWRVEWSRAFSCLE